MKVEAQKESAIMKSEEPSSNQDQRWQKGNEWGTNRWHKEVKKDDMKASAGASYNYGSSTSSRVEGSTGYWQNKEEGKTDVQKSEKPASNQNKGWDAGDEWGTNQWNEEDGKDGTKASRASYNHGSKRSGYEGSSRYSENKEEDKTDVQKSEEPSSNQDQRWDAGDEWWTNRWHKEVKKDDTKASAGASYNYGSSTSNRVEGSTGYWQNKEEGKTDVEKSEKPASNQNKGWDAGD